MMARKKSTNTERKAKISKRPTFKDFESLDPKDRIQKCVEILPEVLSEWEESHPDWRIEVLLWILDASLKSLRLYIDNPDEPEISWESPFVELHFPVQCNWSQIDENRPSFELIAGNITSDDVTTTDSAREKLSKILVEQIQIVALQEFTNFTGFEKVDGEFRAVLDPISVEGVIKHFPATEHDKEIGRLFWPLSFGAGHIDYGSEDGSEDGNELGTGQEISEDAYAQIEAIRHPLLSVPIEADGRKLRVITILEINPLIADRDKREAYFPIVVGLAVQLDNEPPDGETTLDIIDAAAFTEWPDAQRIELWEALDCLLSGMLDEMDPAPDPEMVEAVVAVTAQIRFLVPRNDNEFLSKAVAYLTENLGKGGEIMSMDMRHSGKLLSSGTNRNRIQELLTEVGNSSRPNEKGKSLEALAAALFSSIPFFSVINRVCTESEEIDLWISNHSDTRPFSAESDIILVECKNWSGKCGKNEFVQLYHKIANRSGRCSIAFLISWNGFAETITTEMLRASREAPLIVPIDGNTIRQAVESGDFLQVLTEARQRALMI